MSTISVSNLLKKQVTITIENVVATAKLNQNIKLEKISKKFDNASYNPKKFPGLIIRLKFPRAVILLFRTGSIVCTGATSEKMTKKAFNTFVMKLNELDLKDVSLSNFKIENIVSSANIGKKVHLEQAARTLPRSLYEPEQFPGIIHRVHYPKTVILLFASGKLVCTGGKTTKDIQNSVYEFRDTLEEKNLLVEE